MCLAVGAAAQSPSASSGSTAPPSPAVSSRASLPPAGPGHRGALDPPCNHRTARQGPRPPTRITPLVGRPRGRCNPTATRALARMQGDGDHHRRRPALPRRTGRVEMRRGTPLPRSPTASLPADHGRPGALSSCVTARRWCPGPRHIPRHGPVSCVADRVTTALQALTGPSACHADAIRRAAR